jgi:HK97 gp10 family phage protein
MAAKVRIHTRTRRQYVNGGTRNMIHTVESNAARLAYNYAQRTEGSAKRRVHVITGNLKRSIHRVRLGRGHHRVIVGAYYGVYENYGTRYRPPHPFWEPAIRDARRQYDVDKKKVFRP